MCQSSRVIAFWENYKQTRVYWQWIAKIHNDWSVIDHSQCRTFLSYIVSACNRQMNRPASVPAYLEAVFILKTICINDLLVFFKHFWHTEVPLKHTIVKSHVCRRKWGIIHLQQTIQASALIYFQRALHYLAKHRVNFFSFNLHNWK